MEEIKRIPCVEKAIQNAIQANEEKKRQEQEMSTNASSNFINSNLRLKPLSNWGTNALD
jgi:hypothetical protein